MAITIPSTLELLTPQDFIGQVPSAEEPLHTLLRRLNWLYSTYSPPLVNASPYCSASGYAPAVVFPVLPSADGIAYDITIRIIAKETGSPNTCDISVYEATGYTGSWSALPNSPFEDVALVQSGTGSAAYAVTYTANLGAVDSSTRFIKVAVGHDARKDTQIAAVLIYPRTISSISAGTFASGFVPYDDAALVTAGAAIHREYFDRIWNGVHAIMSDRRCALASFIADSGGLRISTAGTTRRVFFGQTHIPGGGVTAATVHVKFGDTGAGKLMVGQYNGGDGSVVTFDDSTSAQSATIKLYGEKPLIQAVATVGTAMTFFHMVIDYADPRGGSGDYFTGLTPPARSVDLAVMETITMDAAGAVYPCCATFNDPTVAHPSEFGDFTSDGDLVFHLVRTPPFAFALRHVYAYATTGGSMGGGDTDFKPAPVQGYINAAAQLTSIPVSDVVGHGQFPPSNAFAPCTDVAAPETVSTGDADGEFSFSLTEARTPAVDIVAYKVACGFGGKAWHVVNDKTTV